MNRPTSARTAVTLATIAALIGAAAGCSDSPSQPNPGVAPDTVIVDGSASTAYVAFGSPDVQVFPADPATSTAWDVAIAPDLTVKVNGGASGPGGVTAYCLCQNAALTGTQIEALTADGELAAFKAVTSADIPAASAFEADAVVPEISGWYTGTAPTIDSTNNSWVIRYAAGPLFAIFHVDSVKNATMANAGTIWFSYAVQTVVGGAFTTIAKTSVNVAGGAVYFNFATQAIGSSSAWSLQFSGYQILLNGGVSGTGGVDAVITTDPLSVMTPAYCASVPTSVFSSDAFGGVFAAHSWYHYNPTTHLIFPRFETYFIKRGTTVYKVQVSGFYSAAAVPFNYTFRSTKVLN